MSLLLAVGCLAQTPGRLAPDTKLDLVVDPVGFLHRALHLWEPRAAFGHIQNQAAGYLFPMGPFYALGKSLGIPMWVVQRLWMATILIVALWGVVRVAEALGVGSPGTRLIGAATYALSPAMTSLLAYESGGQVAVALLPWILLPLVSGARMGSERRAAARSGLAVAAMGAVNATASISVLPLPALWLLSRRRGPRRRALVRWWALALALACLWWVVPLLLQGRYGLNFVPFTEKASVTTATTSAVEVVRGTGHWLSYLFVNGPWLRGAWLSVSDPLAIGATTALAAGGLYGLARRDMPERTFLALSCAVGVVAIAAGYGGQFGGPVAGPIQHLLDGPLSALRNLSKLEPVLRLPLALGLAHTLAQLNLRSAERTAAVFLAAIVVAVGALPLLEGELVVGGSFQRIPSYWASVAQWLGHHAEGERALIMPAESFGEYRWGRPLDEPLQPLAQSPWGVRDLVPLGSPGLTRLLDAIEGRVDSALPTEGLADVLARAGVRYVVVRNDLDPLRTTGPPPAQVRRALRATAGLSLAASFGRSYASRLNADRLAPDLNDASAPVRAVDVYQVDASVRRAVAYPASGAVVLSGGPESVLQLAGRVDLSHTAVFLKGDLGAPVAGAAGAISADALRRRDVTFGSVRDNVSYALTRNEPAPGSDRSPQDQPSLPPDQSPMRMRGATRVTASSYGSFFARLPERQPWAAFDGDPDTAWVAGAPTSVGEWVRVDLPNTVDPGILTVRLLRDHPWRPSASALRISTERGTVTRKLKPTESEQQVSIPRGQTRWIRISVAATTGGVTAAGVGLREVRIPGVVVDRSAAVPVPLESPGPPSYLLDRLRADPFALIRADEEGNMRRAIRLPGPTTLSISGSVVGKPGADLDALVGRAFAAATALKAEASSTWGALPAFAAGNALDADDRTAWVASPDDRTPSLQLSWSGTRRLDRVIVKPAAGPTLAPTRLLLLSSAGRREVEVTGTGALSFEPLVTDQVSVVLEESASTAGSRSGGSLVTQAATGLSELRFPALDDLRGPGADPNAPVELSCGEGPSIFVDDRPVQTTVSGRVGDLLGMSPLRLDACGPPLALSKGEHRVETADSGPLVVTDVALGSPSAAGSSSATRAVEIRRWAATNRSVTVGAGPRSFLATSENFNAGWEARSGDRRLRPVRIDGWRQGWILPASVHGRIDLSFTPDRWYRRGLISGAVALLVLAVLALLRSRRGLRRPRLEQGRLPAPAVAALAVATAYLLVGWVAVIVVPLVLLSRVPRAVLAGVGFAAAGVIVAVEPGNFPGSGAGAFGGPAQVLTVLAMTALVLSLSANATVGEDP